MVVSHQTTNDEIHSFHEQVFKEEQAPSNAQTHKLKSRNERRYVTRCPLNILAAERGLRFRLNVEVRDAIFFARQLIFGNDERSSALSQVQSAHVGRSRWTSETCRRQANVPMSAMRAFSGCPLCP
jgi:hypothetical protein